MTRIPTRIVVGIDPGLHGGIAVRVNTGRLTAYRIMLMPTTVDKVFKSGKSHPDLDVMMFLTELESFETEWKREPDLVVVEDPPYIPTNGGFATRSLFKAYGEIRGVLIAKGFPMHTVGPKTWQKAILGKLPKPTGKKKASQQKKDASIEYARGILASLLVRYKFDLPYKGPRTKKYHDGIADAICLAEYGARLLDERAGTVKEDAVSGSTTKE